MFSQSAKFIFVEIIGDIFYFPIWWYTKGLKRALIAYKRRVDNSQKNLGLKIWIKNLFKPMFGQYDLQGRIISFFMRLAQIIFRSVFFLFLVLFYFIIFLFWIVLPIFIVIMVILHLGLGNI